MTQDTKACRLKTQRASTSETKVESIMDKAFHRSPGYPQLGLEEAIRRVRLVWNHGKRSPIPVDRLAPYWGFKPASSQWRTIVAALRHFGLLESVGGKKSGEVKLTELALKILLDTREQSVDRDSAIKKAALHPALYREIWNHWTGEIPADDVMRTYLTLNKGFNEGVVSGFISDFKNTVAFANLASSDTIVPADEEDDSEVRPVPMEQKVTRPVSTASPADTASSRPGLALAQPMPQGSPFIHLPLSGGNTVELRLREKFSSDEFDAFLQILKLSKSSLIDPAKNSDDGHKVQEQAARTAAQQANHPDTEGGRGSGGSQGR